jgi:hypothetical protein
VGAALGHLAGLGIVREVTGKRRDRRFAHADYMTILAEGSEPLPEVGPSPGVAKGSAAEDETVDGHDSGHS